jgi:hypothetical protein
MIISRTNGSYRMYRLAVTTLGENSTTVATAQRADPTFAWTLAVSPIIAAILPLAFPTIDEASAFGAAVLLNSVLAIADQSRLSKVGVNINLLWALLLVPVYLIVRTVKAKSTPAIPVVWCAAVLVSLVLANWSLVTGPGAVSMDSPLLERQITEAIRSQSGEAVEVTCPVDVEAAVGSSFPCDVEASDGWYHAYVTVTAEDGSYTWTLTQ